MDPKTHTNHLSETDLEQLAELLKAPPLEDAKQAQAWARRIVPMAQAMLTELETRNAEAGGEFARELRKLIQKGIDRRLNGRAELTDSTDEMGLSVHVMPEGVVVDARLWIHRWKQ